MSAVLEQIVPVPQMRVVPYDKRYEAQVLSMAREMHEESVSHRSIPMNEAKLVQQLESAQTLPARVYFKLCVRGDEVLGVFFGVISTLYFSDELVAKDLAWFVTKTRRGTFAAGALVADFEAWGRENGVSKFMLGQSTGVQIDVTKALYERLGYRVVGFNTVKEV